MVAKKLVEESKGDNSILETINDNRIELTTEIKSEILGETKSTEIKVKKDEVNCTDDIRLDLSKKEDNEEESEDLLSRKCSTDRLLKKKRFKQLSDNNHFKKEYNTKKKDRSREEQILGILTS